MKLSIQKIAIGVASAALFAASALPSLAWYPMRQQPNLNINRQQSLSQSNTASITNRVNQVANTGLNTANWNTKSTVGIATGGINQGVSILNRTGSNYANLGW